MKKKDQWAGKFSVLMDRSIDLTVTVTERKRIYSPATLLMVFQGGAGWRVNYRESFMENSTQSGSLNTCRCFSPYSAHLMHLNVIQY
jgi:hypothetical protein